MQSIPGSDAPANELDQEMPETDPNINENPNAHQENKRIAKMALVKAVVAVMQHKPTVYPPFSEKFHIERDSKGAALYLEEINEEVCKYVKDDYVLDRILNYAHSTAVHLQDMFKFKMTDAKDVLHIWRSLSCPLIPPAMVLQKTTPGRTYKRLPFDLRREATLDDCPIFSELCSRVTDPLALRCWIGSLFDQRASTQQYVWLHGDGGDGKGAMANFLKRCLGDAYLGSEVPSKDGNRFWTYDLLGRRLIVLPDCNNFKFVKTGLFKSLTGGDEVRVEQKGRDAFSKRLNCKFLFLSNEKPDISSAKSDLRRIIYLEITPPPGDIPRDDSYMDRLWKEAPEILGLCWREYAQYSGPGKLIPLNNLDARDNLILDNESRWLHIFLKYFQETPGSYVTTAAFRSVLKAEGITNDFEARNFYSWVERTYQKKRIVKKILGVTTRVFPDIELIEADHIPRNSKELLGN